MSEFFRIFPKIIAELAQGFGITVLLFALTLLLALPLGLIMAFGSMSKIKPIKYVVKGIIWVIRGTPLLLQILLISFLPTFMFKVMNKDLAGFFGISINSLMFVFVLVAFTINYACYFSEIYRAGIESMSAGQYEACKVLGMSKKQIFFQVIFIQVIKRIVPPISNEVITLVKDTSLARVIAVYEIIWNGQAFIKSSGIIWPLFYTGAFYLLFSGLLTLMFRHIEKKLSYFK